MLWNAMGANEVFQGSKNRGIEMNYLYLLVDLTAIAIPLLFSFHPKILLYKKWAYLWPAILLATILFCIWDSHFTKIGVWGFNPSYVTGIYFFHLPIEEILFFICIPYACVFTYFCFGIFYGNNFKLRFEKQISLAIAILALAGAIVYHDRLYTFYTCVGLLAFLTILQFLIKAKWISLFYYSHMFLLIPFFIVNGILTGTGPEKPVVWYNDLENMGVRMLTIPLEDVFYGMFMLLLNVFFFELFQRNTAKIQTI
jgi:lycopene cyclase domain-containing protein